MRLLINIDVPDLERAILFYTAALELKHNRTLDNDVAELIGADATVYLLLNPNASGTAGTLRNYARHWTPVHIDFVVDDITAAIDRALAAGAIQESDCVIWRDSKCITFADPFGHGFCLIEFPGQTVTYS